MKKQLLLIISLCAAIFFVSCDKTETLDDQWKLDNEAQFAQIAAKTGEYTKINSQSTAGYIMYKELESGDGPTPYFTDRVRVLYTGWFKNDWTKPDTITNEKGETFINKKIFNSTDNRNKIPSTFNVGKDLIDGFSTALQNMQVGDKWEIWIPWQLGYGASGNRNNIKPYTTLVFEVELVSIVE